MCVYVIQSPTGRTVSVSGRARVNDENDYNKRISDEGFKQVTRVASASTRKHLPWMQMMDFHFRKGFLCCVVGGCSWKLAWNGRGSFPVISVLENLTQTTLPPYFQQISAHILKKKLHF